MSNHEQITSKVHAPTDKEYTEIIKSELEIDQKYIQNEGQPAKIVYYCKNCKSTVTPTRVGKRLSFKCSTCDREVSFGTENSVHNYYLAKKK